MQLLEQAEHDVRQYSIHPTWPQFKLNLKYPVTR